MARYLWAIFCTHFMKYTWFLLILTFHLVSCSSIVQLLDNDSRAQKENSKYQKITTQDYTNHIESLVYDYLNTSNVKLVQLKKEHINYLTSIYYDIVKNNELLLKNKLTPKFYIINNPLPLYFSAPNAHFFFSTGLIKKYFKHEALLISAFTHEIIKTQLNIYRKKIIVPIGYMRTERMLALNQIPLNIKMELNKWSFLAMKRANLDAHAYLIWLQMQNKNALEFTLLLGNSQNISKEEFLFKNFIAKEHSSENLALGFRESSSSKSFYNLIKYIKKF